jgi:lysine biosynthesis protein LysW
VAKCPECGALIDLEEDEVEEGETFPCPECAVDLEVVNTHPLELDAIGEEEEEEELAEGEDEDQFEEEEEDESEE